jgi:hypothetical protein
MAVFEHMFEQRRKSISAQEGGGAVTPLAAIRRRRGNPQGGVRKRRGQFLGGADRVHRIAGPRQRPRSPASRRLLWTMGSFAGSRRPGVSGARAGRGPAVGQRRPLDLAARGDVLDSCLCTAPGRHGGGGAGTTWLVGTPDEVIAALRRYADLGIRHFVLSDTPYRRELARVGDALIGRLQVAATGGRGSR